MQEIKSKVSGIVFVAVLVLLGAVNPVFIKNAEASIRIHSRANCFVSFLPGYVQNESVTWDDTFTTRTFKTDNRHYESGVYRHYNSSVWLLGWRQLTGDSGWNRYRAYSQTWSVSGEHWIRVRGINRQLGYTWATSCFDYGWGKIIYVPGL